MGDTVLELDSARARGSSSDFTVELDPALNLDKEVDCRLGLISNDIWYLWYNITTDNNLFKYHDGTRRETGRVYHRVLTTPPT